MAYHREITHFGDAAAPRVCGGEGRTSLNQRADGMLETVVCGAAASLLDGARVEDAAVAAEAARLLDALGYGSAATEEPDDGETRRNRSALLRLAGRLERLFPITPPDAPNLIFLGGEARLDTGAAAVSLAGAGANVREAFERCVGEGAEYLSQLARETDIAAHGRPDDVPHGLDRHTLDALHAMLLPVDGAPWPEIAWVAGRRLIDSASVLVPADLCLRGRTGTDLAPLVNVGTGCAAGPSLEAAATAALLEVIERDAAALWWVGGRPPRPVSLEAAAAADAAGYLAHLRDGGGHRHSRLLDITTDLGVPCVAAVSHASDGGGFACGLAAGPTFGSAVRSAITEMCQMELSHRVIALKRDQRGDAALNEHDRAHLDRGRLIDAGHPVFRTEGAPGDWQGTAPGDGPGETIDALLRRLDRAGAAVFAVDCTRPDLSVPVVKVLAPGLQPYPSKIVTSRLSCNHGDSWRVPEIALL